MRGGPIPYSVAELAFCKKHAALPRAELYELFLHKFARADVSFANFKGMCKRNRFLTGRSGQFKPGNIPHPNSGMKGPNKTSFSKGQVPHNYRPVGSTRVTVDGYHETKTRDPKTWKQTHKLIWIKHHGEIPKGMIINFIDGNQSNLSIDNLEAVTRAQHFAINQIKCAHDELRPTVRVVGKLVAATRQSISK